MNELIQNLIEQLATAGNGNAKRSVEELTAHVLECKPLEIYFRDITPEQQAELEALIARAVQGEPVQHIIGHVDFRGLKIHCDRRALIPRPETEQLVEEVLKSKIQGRKFLKIADVGCGTGCVALALLAELPNAEVIGVDVSSDALALARENAERLALSDRITFVQNDLLEGIGEGAFDLIVANLPYIATETCAMLDGSVRDHEPVSALDGGADGLDLICPLVEQAARVLKPDGGLFLEIGYDQGEAVFQCLEKAGFQNVRIVKDLAGLDRIVSGSAEQN